MTESEANTAACNFAAYMSIQQAMELQCSGPLATWKLQEALDLLWVELSPVQRNMVSTRHFPKPTVVLELEKSISGKMNEDDYVGARVELDKLACIVGHAQGDVVRIGALISFMTEDLDAYDDFGYRVF